MNDPSILKPSVLRSVVPELKSLWRHLYFIILLHIFWEVISQLIHSWLNNSCEWVYCRNFGRQKHHNKAKYSYILCNNAGSYFKFKFKCIVFIRDRIIVCHCWWIYLLIDQSTAWSIDDYLIINLNTLAMYLIDLIWSYASYYHRYIEIDCL